MGGKEQDKVNWFKECLLISPYLLGIVAIIGLAGYATCQADIEHNNAIKTEEKILSDEYKLIGMPHLLVPLKEADPAAFSNIQGYFDYFEEGSFLEKKIKKVRFAWKSDADGVVRVSNILIEKAKAVEDQDSTPVAVFNIKPENFIDPQNNRKPLIKDINDYVSGAESIIFSVPKQDCESLRAQSGFKFFWEK